jgi:tetratricopeptide (TPR) repeat protein
MNALLGKAKTGGGGGGGALAALAGGGGTGGASVPQLSKSKWLKGKAGATAQLAEEQLTENEYDPDAWRKLGESHMVSGKFEDAAYAFQQSWNLGDYSTKVSVGLAKSHLKVWEDQALDKKDRDTLLWGIEGYKAAMTDMLVLASSHDVVEGCGRTYEALGNFPGAFSIYSRMIERNQSYLNLPFVIFRTAVVLKHMATHEAGDVLGLASDIEFTPKTMLVLQDENLAAKKKKRALKNKKKGGGGAPAAPTAPEDVLETVPGARSKLEQAAQFFEYVIDLEPAGIKEAEIALQMAMCKEHLQDDFGAAKRLYREFFKGYDAEIGREAKDDWATMDQWFVDFDAWRKLSEFYAKRNEMVLSLEFAKEALKRVLNNPRLQV